MPETQLLPGHSELGTSSTHAAAERFLQHHERRARRIRRALEASGDEPATAFELARRIFPRLPALRIAQATVEAIGHLDVLAAAGHVDATELPAGQVGFRLRTTEA
jgi:hypothetical protein